MEGFKIHLVSGETIKPKTTSEQPFKICLLDQITPRTYLPFVFFYPPQQNDFAFPARLKVSLSEALSRFYPFSGRLKEDNLSVHDFHAGVPFKEARVNDKMSDFLTNRSMTLTINKFLPCRPFSHEDSNPDMPQVAVQLTRFACGGLAIGVCLSHKIADTTTCAAFLNTWAAMTRGAKSEDDLDLLEASARFPGVESLPQLYTSVNQKVWFQPGSYETERFVFDEEALATLKSRARTDVVSNPSRVMALSTFIWARVMSATKTVLSGSCPKTHVLTQPVNIRQRPSNRTVRGNLFWMSIAMYDEDHETVRDKDEEFGTLVELVNESVSEVNNDGMRSIRGDEGFELVTGHFKMIEEVMASSDLDILKITSWVNMGLKDVDFGLGKPMWVGVYGGEGGPELGNLVVLNDATWSKGIEAWVNLDHEVLTVLRNDPEFLALVTVDPSIPIN